MDPIEKQPLNHFLRGTAVHFHPDHRMRDRPPTPAATLRRARRIDLASGLRHAYVGNVRDPDGETTFCHACGEPLIVRDGHALDTSADTSGDRSRVVGYGAFAVAA